MKDVELNSSAGDKSPLDSQHDHLFQRLPTSIGYGVAAGGMTALNAMLASCGQGLLVRNIDNGFGAACGAIRILSALHPEPRP